jgi:uncharacterized membrane protein YfcA
VLVGADTLLTPEFLIALATTVVAGVVRGFSGFGGAIVQAPLFAVLYSPLQAVALISSLGLLGAVQLMPGTFRRCQWRELLPLSLAALVCIPAGAMLLSAVEPNLMRRIISGIVLVMVLILMSGLRYPGRPGPWGSAGIGGLSGIINGATGVGGPPVVLYFLAGSNSAEINRANLIAYYAVLNGGTAVSLWWRGAFTQEILWQTALLFPAQVGALWLGSWLFRRASDQIYRRIALGLMLAVAIFGLLYRR